MTASRADYEALAEVLVSQKDFMPMYSYRRLVDQIGKMYRGKNEKFDMSKWKEACGIPWKP